MTDPNDYVLHRGVFRHRDTIPTGPPHACEHVVYAARRHIDPEPAELCGEPCDPGETLCPVHLFLEHE